MENLRVSHLYVYPIKSCAGIPLESAAVTERGLLFDRRWMVVKEQNGKFVTQRQNSKFAFVKVHMPKECFTGGSVVGKVLEVQAPDMPPLKVPLEVNKSKATFRVVNVWEWTGCGLDEGEEAAQWFSKYLGFPCRLVRYLGSEAKELDLDLPQSSPDGSPPTLVRQVDPTWAPEASEVCFSDGFPILLANQASLDDLVTRAREALPMARFRPNIVIAGAAPWAEDTWRDLQVTVPPAADAGAGAGATNAGCGLLLTSVKPCARCKMPTVDQETGEEGLEPTQTLRQFRSGKALGWSVRDKSWTHDVFFGWNCCLAGAAGLVGVGSTVAIAKRQEGF